MEVGLGEYLGAQARGIPEGNLGWGSRRISGVECRVGLIERSRGMPTVSNEITPATVIFL